MCLLIGNGSSIDIVNKINAYRKQMELPPLQIDLSNLFHYGASFNKFLHVIYVNPLPDADFNAVLSSLFINYNQVPVFE